MYRLHESGKDWTLQQGVSKNSTECTSGKQIKYSLLIFFYLNMIYITEREHMELLMKGLILKLRQEEQSLLKTLAHGQTLKQTADLFLSQIILTLIWTRSLEVASFQPVRV